MKRDRYINNVVTLRLDTHRCTGCGMCTKVCPHDVFSMTHGKAEIINLDACMECGACSRNCPVTAITVKTGVGCAEAIIKGALRGTEPTCGDCCGETAKENNCCC